MGGDIDKARDALELAAQLLARRKDGSYPGWLLIESAQMLVRQAGRCLRSAAKEAEARPRRPKLPPRSKLTLVSGGQA